MSRAKAMMASLSAACAVLSVVVVVLSVRSCQSAQACVETASAYGSDALTQLIIERMKARQARYAHAA